MDRLANLYHEFGQSPWLDNLKRGYITSGQLRRLIDRGIRGLTSNPTIFQKAIQGSPDYDEQFRTLAAANHPIIDDYWAIVLADINSALDVFSELYHDSHGRDGFVSVEVDPGLAHDGAGTETAARHLHQQIHRPNLMVKIPATEEGIAAIQAMIAEGRSINVTLIFSLERYESVMEAYLRGLELYAEKPGANLPAVASVASFFISRVDTEI
ncbi:MAG: transaldolase, partial [Ilumatobacteraceae bacterium]|nr:transaldolase [Ilumatobacteraceae bacterium]